MDTAHYLMTNTNNICRIYFLLVYRISLYFIEAYPDFAKSEGPLHCLALQGNPNQNFAQKISKIKKKARFAFHTIRSVLYFKQFNVTKRKCDAISPLHRLICSTVLSSAISNFSELWPDRNYYIYSEICSPLFTQQNILKVMYKLYLTFV